MELVESGVKLGAWIGQCTPDSGRRCGLAVLQPRARNGMKDTKCRQLVLYQFIDTDQYANLESLLIQLSLNHLYLADKSVDEKEMKKVRQVLDAYPDMTSESIATSAFAEGDILKHIQALTGDSAYLFEKEDLLLARRAAACLFAKGQELKADESAGTGVALVGRLDGALRLDSAAVRALNILPSARDTAALPASADAAASSSSSSAPRATSLYGLLSSKCKTKLGRRTVRSWLLQPLTDVDAIRRRQDVVETFARHPSLLSSWQQTVNLPDPESLALRLSSRKAGMADLVKAYSFTVALPAIAEMLGKATGGSDGDGDAMDGNTATSTGQGLPGLRVINTDYAQPLQQQAIDLSRLRALVDNVLEDPTDQYRPTVKRSYSPELEALGAELDEAEEAVEGVAKKARDNWASDWDSPLKLEWDRQRGYVFRVSRKLDKEVHAVQGVSVLQVLKDGIIFTTEKLSKASESVKDIRAQYDEASSEIKEKAIGVATSYVPALESVGALLGELDALASMGHIATLPDYCRPTIVALQDGAGSSEPDLCRSLRIISGRHPLVELQDGVSYIANDYIMHAGDGSAAEGGGRFHIVTGPNMGGKSTYIRTLGVQVVLAQIGAFLPAAAATVPVFEAVLARVGAGDAALRGVSTFMAEMLEAGTILATASPSSLVLIDELGRGTSTYDGFGLAWAISEQLAAKTRCFTLFATHFHELCALEDETPGVRNKHVSAHTDGGRITMLYEVKEGPCPTSFGVHVAELAGFPKVVVDMARVKALELEGTATALHQEAKQLHMHGHGNAKRVHGAVPGEEGAELKRQRIES